MPLTRHITITAALLASSVLYGSAAEDSLTVIDTQINEIMSVAPVFDIIYANPAMTELRRDHSYSSAGIAWYYRGRHSDKPFNPATGSGETRGSFTAGTHLKHNRSTLTGFAGYTTGKIKSIQWCETSDYDIIYPYIMADDTGGDLNEEIYRFGGGISTSNGPWHYGASLAYRAGLYYRNIDPRPRNVTGLLNLSVGGGISAGRHVYAVAVTADKYKQTNSIKFMSELGSAKIYHLTGLGTDYTRFAGSGESTYYTGWRYGAAIDMHPVSSHKGIATHIGITRFTFSNIISDLNKLPMAKVRETEYSAEAGWIGRNIAAKAYMHVTRRLGDENIFGDAQSGSYPQIATLTLYAHNRIYTGADMDALIYTGPRVRVGITLHTAYDHDNQIQSSAGARRVINNVSFRLGATATLRTSHSSLFTAEIAYGYRKPLESRFQTPENGIPGAIEAAYTAYLTDAHRLDYVNTTFSVTTALPHNLALHISAAGSISTISTHCTISTAIIF